MKELTAGDTFGEMALIEDKPRGATILCLEDCDFITFEKAAFVELLSKLIEVFPALADCLPPPPPEEQETQKLRGEIALLSSCYLFKDFSLNLLKNLFLLCSVHSFRIGDTLFKEGDATDRLFFIRDGEIKVTRERPD